MKLNKKYLMLSLVLATGFSYSGYAKADELRGKIDTSGDITGKAGATYYDTNSWKDIGDTYKGVTPDASSDDTVFFNVIGEIFGEAAANAATTVTEGKSVSIIGNKNTLHLNVSKDDKGDGRNANGSGGLFRSTGKLTPSTSMKIENAKIINNITGGIFQQYGTSSEGTQIYKNVFVQNGRPYYYAKPIYSTRGHIVLSGNNIFNIYQNGKDMGTGRSITGADNQGEWIEGGALVEVIDGTTTLNQDWWWDQPWYSNSNGPASKVKIADDSHLIWNLNNTFTMYWGDGHAMDVNWSIGDNASFEIYGTSNTFTGSGQWFSNFSQQEFTLDIGENGKFVSSTAGGAINIGSFSKPVVWNLEKDSELVIDNHANTSVFSGNPTRGSSMNLKDPRVVTFNTVGSNVFSSGISNFPINIEGDGLRTHTSNKVYSFNSSFDSELPNKRALDKGDIWYRKSIGTIKNLGSGSVSNSLEPNKYSAKDMTTINNAKYLSFYQPIGFWEDSELSKSSRTFTLSLDPAAANGLPLDGSWSDFRNGNATQSLVFGDDRGQTPNFDVNVTMTDNPLSDSLEYYWTDPADKSKTSKFELDQSIHIASVKSDTDLPNFIKASNAGQNYTFDIPTDTGIRVKAKNNLDPQTNTKAGTFKYTIIDGPKS